MNQRRLVIFTAGIAILILLLLLIVWWRQSVEQNDGGGQETAATELFPSGELRPATVPGEFSGLVSPPATSTGEGVVPALPASGGKFFRLSSRPVAGATILGAGATSSLIYAEKSTGHLYRLANGSAAPERISNTTRPKIYRFYGGESGTSTQVVFHYLKSNQIETFLGRLTLPPISAGGEDFLFQDDEPAPISGQVIAGDIYSLSVSPEQNKIFWLERRGGGTDGYLVSGAVGYLLSGDGKKEKIFSSPLDDWQAAWVATTTLALQTTPSRYSAGALYSLNTKTKKMERLIGGVPALTALANPRLDRLFYSGMIGDRLVSGFYDPGERFFSQWHIKTWADKCVWATGGEALFCAVPETLPPGDYPEDWYRGETDLNDNIWRITASSGHGEIIFNSRLAGQGIRLDAEGLLLSGDENTIYLINRQDGNLWALNLAANL